MNNTNPIGQAIESYLLASRIREEDPFKTKKYYVSDMGKCYRMRWLKRKGITSSFENFVYWTFQLGDLIHEFGYKALEAQGLLLATEEYVSTDHFVGKFDGKIKNQEGLPSLFDFKSANPYKMKKLVAGGDDGAEDAMQVLTYVMFYQKDHPNTSDVGTVVYINKEPSEKVETTIAISKDFHLNLWKEKIDSDIEKMIEYWVTDKIPPCTCPAWMRPYNTYLPFCEMSEIEVEAYLAQMKEGKKIISSKNGVTVQEAHI